MERISVQTFHYRDERPDRTPDKPDEDFVLIENNVFAVFDGLTMLHQRPYPDPSPAYQAAEIAARSVVRVLSESTEENGSGLAKKAFSAANNDVRKLNQELGLTEGTVDGLQRQYAATVGVFGFFRGDTFYFGQINDSGVTVLSPTGDKLAELVVNSEPLKIFLRDLELAGSFGPGSVEEHVFVRKNIVNNPDFNFAGERIEFGVLTGEGGAEPFFKFGEYKLNGSETVLLYSDGFIPFLETPDFVESLLLAGDDKERLNKAAVETSQKSDRFKKERSLVVIRFPSNE